MFRRKFFGFLGLGGAAAAATLPAIAQAETPKPEEKRDLKWAQARSAEGKRVRLECWEEDEINEPSNIGAITFRFSATERQGLIVHSDIAVTVGMIEGPWELVPEEDYPKPPQPVVYTTVGQGGAVTITGGSGMGSGGAIFLTTGDSPSTGRAGYVEATKTVNDILIS